MTRDLTVFDDPHLILDNTGLVSRFLAYARFPTQADDSNESCPSSPGQTELASHLAAELRGLGISNSHVDDNSYVYAQLGGNAPGACIGFIAHMDTAMDFPGDGVSPRLHENYSGGVISLQNNILISPDENPELHDCIGDTIITGDGTTLLGADDKAGIAIIMSALEYIIANPHIRRPALSVCFTPDEEIGRGPERFDIDRFNADCAYTVDGGFTGEINSENFNAQMATMKLRGVTVHPGRAYGKMVNALDAAAALLRMLPSQERPQSTRGREGFFHPIDISGDAAAVTLRMILRDFDPVTLRRRGAVISDILENLKQRHKGLEYELDIKEQYRNTAQILAEKPQIAAKAREAMGLAGVTPRQRPLRGGTDGAELTAHGLPCVNLFIGGANYHGPREWVSTRAMALSACTLLNLVQLWADR